jgi:hypothetical protein
MLNREDILIGPKNFGTLMDKMGIAAIYRKRNTSGPHPRHPFYPYLLKNLPIDRPNHIWATDIISMLPRKTTFLTSFLTAFTMLIGSIESSLAGETSAMQHPTKASAAADFFHLVVVPDQTVTNGEFEVQVIAENIDPNSPPSVPFVFDASGKSSDMALKHLKWPGTNDDSVTVYSVKVRLARNRTNNIKVLSGNKQIAFSIRHKSALNVRVASSRAELIRYVKAAISDPSIDVVEVGYEEQDLGGTLHNVGNSIPNKRSTWLTIKPATGRSVVWSRDSGTPNSRPMTDLLHLRGVVFGSDTADGGGGLYYAEVGHRVWLSETEFRAKYKRTWPKNARMTSNFLPDIRVVASEGQKVYLTDCLWDGTASIAATTSVELGRDLRFYSHRGDFNNFGKVFLNGLAEDASPVRNASDTDFLHNDGFQIWGTATDLVFKGFQLASPNVPAEVQPFFFDRTFSPRYSNILVDSLIIVGASNTLNAQLAGNISNSRISNVSFPTQAVTIRQDFTEPNGSFAPSNVYMNNALVGSVNYLARGTSKLYRGSTQRPIDISHDLNGNSNLSGAKFSGVIASGRP